MILYFVLVGFVTGALGAGFVLYAGGGFLFALLAYSFTGALGVVLSALIIAIAPTFRRPRTRTQGRLPAGAHAVRARSSARPRPVRTRPVRARHLRVEAQAPRR